MLKECITKTTDLGVEELIGCDRSQDLRNTNKTILRDLPPNRDFIRHLDLPLFCTVAAVGAGEAARRIGRAALFDEVRAGVLSL